MQNTVSIRIIYSLNVNTLQLSHFTDMITAIPNERNERSVH